MCGIAGFVRLDQPAQPSLVQAMCGEIRHRGPDDEGVHVDRGCGIGMRRLSIIDLSTGHQPISNEDGSVWIVFNGEIYSYQELRADLMARGHQFRTASDTETLVHLYEQEGVEGLKRLRGMFAFAIWDARQSRLLLARDRFGKKPLYYAVLPNGIWFGSEISCLRQAGVPLDTDPEALRLYFQFNYIPDPLTAYRAIRRVPAAGWLTYERGAVRQGRYWQMPAPVAEPAPGFTHAEAVIRVREKFDEAVRIRMIADVPLGAFLSGGIDSSSVVASMALQSPEPIKTFSIGFEESRFNELPYARMVADKYATDHHEIVVRPDSIGIIQKFIKHFGEPFADSSAIPTFIVSEFAARSVKVALSGDGGDELFGGYTSFQQVQRYQPMDRVPQSLRLLISWISARLPYSAYGKNFLHMIGRRNGLDRYFAFNYAARLDDARRGRLPGANSAPLHPARRRRHALPGNVLGGYSQSHRRHAGEGGSHVHGEFARSEVADVGPRAGRARRDHSARLEDRRRAGQAHPAGRTRRPPARGVAQPPEVGFRRTPCRLVSRLVARVSPGPRYRGAVPRPRHRLTRVPARPAGRTR